MPYTASEPAHDGGAGVRRFRDRNTRRLGVGVAHGEIHTLSHARPRRFVAAATDCLLRIRRSSDDRASDDGGRDDRYSWAVDEIDRVGGVEDDQVGALARRQRSDVVASQRGGSAGRGSPESPRRSSCSCRAPQARCRTTSTSCSSSRGCSSSPARRCRRRRAAGGRRGTAGGSRSRWPAGTWPPCRCRRARRCRRRRGRCSGRPTRSRARPPAALPARGRVGWRAVADRARRRDRPAARPRLIDVERAALAEGIDPSGVRRARRPASRRRPDRRSRRSRPSNSGGTTWAPRNVGLVGQARRRCAASAPRRRRQPVTRLDLDGRRARPPSLGQQRTWPRSSKLVVGRGTGGCDRRADPTRFVRTPGHPRGELVGPVAAEDEMAVAVDEAREHAATRSRRCRSSAAGARPVPTLSMSPSTDDHPGVATAVRAHRRRAVGSLVISRPMLSMTSDAAHDQTCRIGPVELGGDVDGLMHAVGDDDADHRRRRGCTSAAVAAKTTAAAACRGSDPARRGDVEADRRRGRRGSRRRCDRRRASQGCGSPSRVARGQQLARLVRAALQRRRAARRARSPASLRTDRSPRASRCRSPWRLRRRAAGPWARCRRRGRARSSGRCSTSSRVSCSRPTSSSSRCVACTAVKRSPSTPLMVEQLDRRAAVDRAGTARSRPAAR